MTNRWIRILLAVIAIAAASVAAYRVVQIDQQLAASLASSRHVFYIADTALVTAEDLKASLHAYVAPGQGLPFWSSRAAQLLDRLRGSLLELDSAAVAAGGPFGESLDAVDRLAASEQRARDHMQNEQALLAGDVIFNDARELLDGLRRQIAAGREHILSAAAGRDAAMRREQAILVGGAAGVLALVLLMLVPAGRAPSTVQPEALRADEPAPMAPVVTAGPDASALASICAALAAVRESSEIEPILEQARELLAARGLIVWLSSPDRMELHSAAASGYDARVLARLGPIHRETSNLTANAFRENAPRTSAAAGTAAAALAVPLPSPEGPAGVFSVELTAGTDVDEGKLAAARVIAAQLGGLLGSIPGGQAGAPPVATAARSSS